MTMESALLSSEEEVTGKQQTSKKSVIRRRYANVAGIILTLAAVVVVAGYTTIQNTRWASPYPVPRNDKHSKLALDLLIEVKHMNCSGALADVLTEALEGTSRQQTRVGSLKGRRLFSKPMHAKQTKRAVDFFLEEQHSHCSGAFTDVLTEALQATFPKVTSGTCKWLGCYSSRGVTDCMDTHCVCQDGYGTIDGQTCQPLSALRGRSQEAWQNAWPESYTTDTGGTCTFGPCDLSRGPVTCATAPWYRKPCVCASGYAAVGGICILKADALTSPMREQVKVLTRAGAVEPDAMPCPGADGEMGTEGLEAMWGTKVYNVSICRKATQIYHASPIPLVPKNFLTAPAIPNLMFNEGENVVEDLFALTSVRQWRTNIIRLLSVEFMYAIVKVDVVEAARRMGNMFHTFEDSFSASHVDRDIRTGQDMQGKPSRQVCEGLAAEYPLSMDVVDWPHHVIADMKDDILSFCTTFWDVRIMRLWLEARKHPIKTASEANDAIDKLLHHVLCPALSVDSLDAPTGGASAFYSADTAWIPLRKGQAIVPRGLATEQDAAGLIEAYNNELQDYRNTLQNDEAHLRLVPNGIYVPPRGLDICEQPTFAHVTDAQIDVVLRGEVLSPYVVGVEWLAVFDASKANATEL